MSYDLEKLGAAISEALKSSRVKKADLTRAVGKSWPAIHNWCVGKHPPPFKDLVTISELTGVPIGELVDSGAPDIARSPYPVWEDFLATEEAQRANPLDLKALGAFRFRARKVPTVETYKRMLFAMESTESEIRAGAE